MMAKKVPVEAFHEVLKMYADGLEKMIKKHQGEPGFDKLFFQSVVHDRISIMIGFCLGMETMGLIDKEGYRNWIRESTRTFNAIVDTYFK